ncbi:MAG TPA: cytochrome c maturation protein CcmE [Chitinophagales bacterium]|nr:cytochrome c maturation protein CcmE [Chitinophagales bacterium]HRK27807.1 cytochrome c maturation protein CcmE [Chitinophagales bacterium]
MKKSHIAALLVIGSLIAYIIGTSSNYSTYETFATAQQNEGKEFQVVGVLSADKEQYYNPEEDANRFTFFMKDETNEERKVVYYGTKPTDFERSEKIVLTGKMKGNEFHATKILLKCPSKYIEDKLDEKGYYAPETAATVN